MTMPGGVGAVVILVLSLSWSVCPQEADDLRRLFDDKIWSCNPYIRPVINQSDSLNVSIRLNIVAITDFNEVIEKLSFTAWLNVSWYDKLLAWDPDQYGGVLSILPPVDKIWHPNIAVANTMATFNPLMESTGLVNVYSDGQIQWAPGTNFHVYCEVDTTTFPFDAQECLVELLIWDYTLYQVDLQAMKDTVGTTAFMSNGEWTIVSTSVSREVRYPAEKPKPFVVAKLIVKRRPQFVLVNVILPTALLTILNCFVFLIPVDSGEKISFAVTLLLAYGVLMSYITDMLPQTSKTTSSLSIYMVTSLIFSSCFVMLAILITRLYRKNETESPVPVFLACFTRRMEHILCRKGNGKLSVHSRRDSCENQNSIDKMVIVRNSLSLSYNETTNPRYYGNTKKETMTWKRVSKCLDLTLFLLFFPIITAVSIVVMVEDFISSETP